MENPALQVGLNYTIDSTPGITRKRKGDGFAYFGPDGKAVKDEVTLERIRHLAIPPAYEHVWICPDPDGHLQATGRDAKGRKQYRYHPKFRESRDESKFGRMIEFGESLPSIHQRLAEDLAKRGLPREKVLAAVVELLERSLIRVGNEEYARENRSYGLTTLKNRHATVEGSEVTFQFRGKSKVRHRITLKDRRHAKIVRSVQDLPGQHLFEYVDHDGNVHTIRSNDVNAYLREIGEGHFTAKDFRTWAGTILALQHLSGIEPASSVRHNRQLVTRVVKEVAKQLGNTPSVCRKSYVHPRVFQAFENGELVQVLSPDVEKELAEPEQALLKLLRLETQPSVKVRPRRNRRVA